MPSANLPLLRPLYILTRNFIKGGCDPAYGPPPDHPPSRRHHDPERPPTAQQPKRRVLGPWSREFTWTRLVSIKSNVSEKLSSWSSSGERSVHLATALSRITARSRAGTTRPPGREQFFERPFLAGQDSDRPEYDLEQPESSVPDPPCTSAKTACNEVEDGPDPDHQGTGRLSSRGISSSE